MYNEQMRRENLYFTKCEQSRKKRLNAFAPSLGFLENLIEKRKQFRVYVVYGGQIYTLCLSLCPVDEKEKLALEIYRALMEID